MTAPNRCDQCQRDLPADDGGLCAWCIQAIYDERSAEWWAEVGLT